MNAAIILARMDSSRFPSKATSLLGDKRLIEWSIDAILTNTSLTPILATTNRDVDQPLQEVAIEKGIHCFRGDLNNVAKRVAHCIKHFKIDYFARINGDSPFIMTDLLQESFELLEHKEVDFVTNLVPRSFPYGLSIEVFKSSFFLEYYQKFDSPALQEHMTSYFYKNIEQFNVHKITYPDGNQHDVRLVVDTPEDKVQVEQILAQLPKQNVYQLDNLINAYKKLA